MKKQFLLSILSICIFTNVFSQAIFQKIIGGPTIENGHSYIQTSEGGFAACGLTGSYGAGAIDVYVVKLNNNGILQWTKTIGGSGFDRGDAMIQSGDGGYLIVGSTASFGAGNNDIYAVKLDSSGNLQWQKTIGGSNSDLANSVIQSNDGGYVIGAVTSSFGAGSEDIYIVKLDNNGNMVWAKTIGGGDSDICRSIIKCNDGGYIATGSTISFGEGFQDIYIVKLDSTGNLQWTKTVGGSGTEVGNSIVQSSDGGYTLGGLTTSFGAGAMDVYIVKLDSIGNLLWTKTIGGSNGDGAYAIIQTLDGGYAAGGSTSSFGAGSNDFYLVKLDSSGNLQYTKTTGGTNQDLLNSIIQTTDGGFGLGGTTSSFGAINEDFYLVKCDSVGNSCGNSLSGGVTGSGGIAGSGGAVLSAGGTIGTGGIISSGGVLTLICTTLGINEPENKTAIEIFPNPSPGLFKLTIAGSGEIAEYTIEIYNLLGATLNYSIHIRHHPELTIDLSSQPKGIYFLKIVVGETIYTRKIIVQ